MKLKKMNAEKIYKEPTRVEEYKPFLFKENLQLEGHELRGSSNAIPITLEKTTTFKYLAQQQQQNFIFDVLPVTEIMLPPNKAKLFITSDENPKQLVVDVNVLQTMEVCPNLLKFAERPISWYYAALFKSEILKVDFQLPENKIAALDHTILKSHIRRLKKIISIGNKKFKEEGLTSYFDVYMLFQSQQKFHVILRDVVIGFSRMTIPHLNINGRVWWFVDYAPRPAWMRVEELQNLPSTIIRSLMTARLEMSYANKIKSQGYSVYGPQLLGIINPYINRVNVYYINTTPEQKDLVEAQTLINLIGKYLPIISQQCVDCEFKETCYNSLRSYNKLTEVR